MYLYLENRLKPVNIDNPEPECTETLLIRLLMSKILKFGVFDLTNPLTSPELPPEIVIFPPLIYSNGQILSSTHRK